MGVTESGVVTFADGLQMCGIWRPVCEVVGTLTVDALKLFWGCRVVDS